MMPLVVLCAMLIPANDAEPRVETNVRAQGDWPHLAPFTTAWSQGRRELAIRTNAELTQALGGQGMALARQALGVPAIDLRTQMLLVIAGDMQPMVGVSGGGPPSALYRVEIAGIENDAAAKTVKVSWGLIARGPNDPIITSPVALALTQHTDTTVRFKQLPRQDKPQAPKAVAPKGKEPSILARGAWLDGWRQSVPSQAWSVRRYRDLIDPRMAAPEDLLERFRQANAARYAKALKVARIDWEKRMVLGISAGTEPGDGYAVEVTSVEVDRASKVLTVHWKVKPPAEGQEAGQTLTNPARVVLLDQFDGEVRLDPPADLRKPWQIVPVVGQ